MEIIRLGSSTLPLRVIVAIIRFPAYTLFFAYTSIVIIRYGLKYGRVGRFNQFPMLTQIHLIRFSLYPLYYLLVLLLHCDLFGNWG